MKRIREQPIRNRVKSIELFERIFKNIEDNLNELKEVVEELKNVKMENNDEPNNEINEKK